MSDYDSSGIILVSVLLILLALSLLVVSGLQTNALTVKTAGYQQQRQVALNDAQMVLLAKQRSLLDELVSVAVSGQVLRNDARLVKTDQCDNQFYSIDVAVRYHNARVVLACGFKVMHRWLKVGCPVAKKRFKQLYWREIL